VVSQLSNPTENCRNCLAQRAGWLARHCAATPADIAIGTDQHGAGPIKIVDGGVPAYWPWIQVIRGCLKSSDSEKPRSALESELTPAIVLEVAQIVPELRSPSQPPRPPAGKVDAEEARFRLCDSVATFFKSFARRQPVLIVIDDLHDADLASLAMLKFVAGAIRDANILIVGTYRDAEMHRSAERLKLIEETLREGNQLPLAGLAEAEVASMVEAIAGQAASEALVAKLHGLTAGNPLFIDGVARVLAAEGKLAGLDDSARTEIKLPAKVLGAIAGRLGMLSEEVRRVLARAAVIGPGFELALLAQVSELNADSVAGAIDEACGVGIVASAGRGRWRFTHPLIHEALFKGQRARRESRRIAR
jgi:predicted ATPase